MMYEGFPFSKDQGKFLLAGKNGSTPKFTRPSFQKNHTTPFFERIILSIFGILFFIFATYYLEIIAPPENLSAFHWIWH
ncbi:MAG: hypothetical protein MRJ67_06320 [Nitrospirales bacterium]|nr:hypothetical protein [Nitrospira sp.]MDR4460119.1 hypothetical protein [Nitrospirales bacterium]MDR4482962.1 hypothetical protein [Nitrospirales bacterium]